MSSYYKPGTWNVICDLCGRQFKSDEVRKRWDGLIVCKNDYEPRHILDFIKPHPERTTVPYVRKEPEDVFVEVHYYEPPVDVPPVVVPPVDPPPVVVPPPVDTPPPPTPVIPPSDPSPTGDITARADYARADFAQADRAA